MTPPWRLVSYSVEARLLHQTAAGGEHEVRRDVVVADVEDLRDLLVGLQREQVRDVLTLGVAAGLGDLVRLRAVDAALRREEQQPVVGRGDEEVLDDVVGAQLRALDALAAAVLLAVVVAARALDVAVAGDGDDHLLFGDEVFDRHVAVEAREDLRCGGRRRTVDDRGQLVADDRALALGVGEDRLEVGDLGLELGRPRR